MLGLLRVAHPTKGAHGATNRPADHGAGNALAKGFIGQPDVLPGLDTPVVLGHLLAVALTKLLDTFDHKAFQGIGSPRTGTAHNEVFQCRTTDTHRQSTHGHTGQETVVTGFFRQHRPCLLKGLTGIPATGLLVGLPVQFHKPGIVFQVIVTAGQCCLFCPFGRGAADHGTTGQTVAKTVAPFINAVGQHPGAASLRQIGSIGGFGTHTGQRPARHADTATGNTTGNHGRRQRTQPGNKVQTGTGPAAALVKAIRTIGLFTKAKALQGSSGRR